MVLQSPESRGVSHRGLSEELVVLRCMMHMQRRVWLAMAVPGVAAENLATLNPTYSLSSFFGSPYRILTIHFQKKGTTMEAAVCSSTEVQKMSRATEQNLAILSRCPPDSFMLTRGSSKNF